MAPEILANYVFDRVCGKEPIDPCRRLSLRRAARSRHGPPAVWLTSAA